MEKPEMPCLGNNTWPSEMSGSASDEGKEDGIIKDPTFARPPSDGSSNRNAGDLARIKMKQPLSLML